MATPYAEKLAAKIRMERASVVEGHGMPDRAHDDISGKHTTHFSAADAEGNWVACTATINTGFGSKVVVPGTGVTWQNRGTSFSLDPHALNALEPGRKPFHTLNPSMALFDDGRIMPFGTMGGEGQPQTQSAIFSRHAMLGVPLQEAITRPRWLLGKMWGEETTTLKLERRFDPKVVARLKRAGHDVELVGDFSVSMGHAGAIVRRADGGLEGATDPRGDGAVAAF